MISNPATFFVNSNDDQSFTYEGGSKLFQWSPYDSGLSSTMESNVIFFANDEDHARDVLRRMFEFWIDCNERYVGDKAHKNDRHGLAKNAQDEIKVLRRYLASTESMVINEAPTNQFYKAGWSGPNLE